jgi:hypothetical protein
MDIEKFYILSSKLSSSTFQVHATGFDRKLDDNDLAVQWCLILGDYSQISLPVIFKHKYGKKLEDMLDTGWPSLYLISDKLKTVLEDNELTGWKTFAVQIFDKKGGRIQGFHGLSITGRCGEIDYNKSTIIEKNVIENGPTGKYYKGLHVGLDKWDGSDFFLPAKYFGIILTDKAAQILKKNKLTNIRLENLAEVEIPDFAIKR